MVKKSKKVNIFSEAERIEIDEILLNLVREMQNFLDRQSNPKEFAEKLLSASKSDSAIAGQIQKRYSLDMEPYQTISPQELCKILPQEMLDKSSYRYVKPVQRTYILNQLRQGGYYEPQPKSKNIRYPGRPKSTGVLFSSKERGGRPSEYTITREVIKLRRFIANENATQYIQKRLKNIGILQEFFKFIMLAFFYALRKDELNRKGKKGIMYESLILLLPFFSLSKYINSANWKADQIRTKNEAQLTDLAQEISCIAVDDPLIFLLFIETMF